MNPYFCNNCYYAARPINQSELDNYYQSYFSNFKCPNHSSSEASNRNIHSAAMHFCACRRDIYESNINSGHVNANNNNSSYRANHSACSYNLKAPYKEDLNKNSPKFPKTTSSNNNYQFPFFAEDQPQNSSKPLNNRVENSPRNCYFYIPSYAANNKSHNNNNTQMSKTSTKSSAGSLQKNCSFHCSSNSLKSNTNSQATMTNAISRNFISPIYYAQTPSKSNLNTAKSTNSFRNFTPSNTNQFCNSCTRHSTIFTEYPLTIHDFYVPYEYPFERAVIDFEVTSMNNANVPNMDSKL